MTSTSSILVLGGGPAGAAASRLLALWGHSVRLITRPAADHRLAVSIPPSCAKLFDAIGVTTAIARAGFIRATGNTVWWGQQDARVERFADGGLGW
ncbi:MAG: FAD-dependent monooxygenase, partial [Vicinamibacterales bacterium]